MNDLLEKRARELSQRIRRKEPSGQFFLVSRWGTSGWAFTPSEFLAIVAGPELTAPVGTTLKSQRCTAFLRYEGQILPVIDWSDMVAVEEREESLFLVARTLEFALRISSRCGLQRLEDSAEERPDTDDPGEVEVADLREFF